MLLQICFVVIDWRGLAGPWGACVPVALHGAVGTLVPLGEGHSVVRGAVVGSPLEKKLTRPKAARANRFSTKQSVSTDTFLSLMCFSKVKIHHFCGKSFPYNTCNQELFPPLCGWLNSRAQRAVTKALVMDKYPFRFSADQYLSYLCPWCPIVRNKLPEQRHPIFSKLGT